MRLDEYMPSVFMCFLRGESGASFSECALVASLIAVVCAMALLAIGKGT